MILRDHALYEVGASIISPFDVSKVSSICYDLSVGAFCPKEGEETKSITLAPYESVFVKSVEVISLPNDIMAEVILRNSRIRQGLELSAPVYHPGHRTYVFFRITNVSKSNIELTDKQGIAAIMFNRLDDNVDHPYEGAFSEEMNFSGMGKYTSQLSAGMTDIEQKVDNLKHMERNVYSNVLSILAVFVAIFSLINVNMNTHSGDMASIITINLTTVGSIGFLIALINTILDGKYKIPVWCASVLAFVAAVVVQLLF